MTLQLGVFKASVVLKKDYIVIGIVVNSLFKKVKEKLRAFKYLISLVETDFWASFDISATDKNM